MRECDQHCTCPYTREIFWNPEHNWTTLQSREALNKNSRIEVINFKTNKERRYQIQNDYIKNSQKRIRINAIESIYMKDAFSIIAHIIAGFFREFLLGKMESKCHTLQWQKRPKH